MNLAQSNDAADAPLLTRRDGAVFHVILNRPETRNPLGAEMVEHLEDALDRAEADAAVRVLAVSAVGPAFSAGGNLGNIAGRIAAQPEADGQDPVAMGNRRYGRFLERFAGSSKITVVLAQGAAMGGGAGLVCAADLAAGARGSRFGFPEVSIGLVPAQILPFVAARIGLQAARRLMLTGERIDADAARAIGLLDYVFDAGQGWEEGVAGMLQRCADAAPRAAGQTKSMLRALFGQQRWHEEELGAYLDSASRSFARQLRTEAIEGVAAAKAKRRPDWDAVS
ncbi:enoyl-CoA hydratase [Achromobacter sp. RTa]|uniref:enoyl-CoA hydratase/isomerase family protein n=1 Tax=Achromobacter sp. RTa TaxID=1532557 RepID=UPI00050FEEB5|nr:enoyl-CoA hydratase-related protein [Achromobacter sp. RTa]KGD90579.1 enoyl-CoA hydratase [Achromobacter sp. RTa]